MKFLSYYTIDTPYQQEWEHLETFLEKFGLSYDVRPMPSRGSWQANTQMKANVIKEYLKEAKEPFTYLDVDAEILSRPSLLFDLDCDIAAARFGGHTLLSGTVYFAPTPKTAQVVERWIELCKQYPDFMPGGLLSYIKSRDFAWDQRLLDVAIQQTDGVRFVELPISYTYIWDLCAQQHPGVEPVILHTAASRKYRETVT